MSNRRSDNSDARAASLERLAERIKQSGDVADVLGESRLVFGTGNPMSAVVLVGEAPGADEERQGKPFVGRAGQLLDRALDDAGLDREKVWITNVVKIRPTEPGAKGGRRNRPPSTVERKAFRPFLDEELSIIQPRSVVCLGATAAAAVLGRSVKISKERGEWVEGPADTRVLTTYHPAYLLRPFRDRDEKYQQLVDDLRKADSGS